MNNQLRTHDGGETPYGKAVRNRKAKAKHKKGLLLRQWRWYDRRSSRRKK